VTSKISDDFGVDLSFSYPEDWTLSRKMTGEKLVSEKNIGEETITITSPDKSYSVLYNIGANGGLGGMCDPEQAGVIKTFSFSGLNGFPSATFVSRVTSEGGRYDSYAGLFTSTLSNGKRIDYSKVKPGDSVCDQYLSYIIGFKSSRKNFNVQSLNMSIQTKGMTYGRFGDKEEGFKSYDDAKAAMSGETYEKAKEILLSTTLNS
jgi:hypothetical protein